MARLHLVLLLGSLVGTLVVDAASNAEIYDKVKNGVDLCNEADYQNGGPSAPLYNYASDGSDWKGFCLNGTAQSPIDLPGKNASSLSALNSTITFGSVTAVGNAVLRLEVDEVELISGNWTKSGFSIPVCGSDIGCLMTPNPTDVQRITPNISNLHFHANSEHTRDGQYYGAEAHLVTSILMNGTAKLVVFGVWMDLSGNQTNPLYEKLQPYVDMSKGPNCEPIPNNIMFNLTNLFPANKSYVAYRGSLTTPPCTEGVTWIVFTTPVKMSIPQVKSLYQSSAHINQPCAQGSNNQICNVFGARTNNRPLQDLNDRQIHVAMSGGASSS
ncbi:g8601 [Coccomyxa viridis]|uniref:carbonic anhydrase n=1 Tax=Coccomyxa viridis TaxID=1274662 RepID=A0ABP1G0R1_9CHLO